MDEMIFDVQTMFLIELMSVLDEKRPTVQAEAMLKLAEWYKDELQNVVRYVTEQSTDETAEGEADCKAEAAPGEGKAAARGSRLADPPKQVSESHVERLSEMLDVDQ